MFPHQHLSNTELIQLLKQRDKNALSYLYDTYAPSLHGVIVKLVKDKDLAGEVLKKAFIKIWNNSATFDFTKQSLFIYMYSITYEVARAELTNAPKVKLMPAN